MMCAVWRGVGIGSVRRDKAGAVVGEDPTGVAAAHGEFSGRGVEAVKGQSVVGAPAPAVVPIAIDRLGGGDEGTGAPSTGQRLIIEQYRRPDTMRVRVQVASQRTDEQVRAHSVFLVMVARGQASAGILLDDEPGQILFVKSRQPQRIALDRSAGLHRSLRTHPPERRVRFELFGPDLRQQIPVESEAFAQLPDLVGDGVRGGGFAWIHLDHHRIHRIVEVVLVGIAVAESFGQGDVVPQPDGGELEGGMGQPFHAHGDDPASLGGVLRGDEAVESQVPDHGGEQRFDMAVGDGAFDGDGVLGAAQALALEHSVKALDLGLVCTDRHRKQEVLTCHHPRLSPLLNSLPKSEAS